MWYLFGFFFFGVVVAAPAFYNDIALPRVTIDQGSVVGTVAADGNYFEFHGIPYADSTSGSHRFKAPLPPPSFTNDFIATRKDIICMRPLGTGFEGTEDCLVANIFTPSIVETSNLPVMVWIKGMEFDRPNEKDYSFKHLVEKEVVVVSLNFRESIFGFLCLGTETAPGNAGLKDIIAGLRWLKQNIAQFGGNPDDITLFGHGSGAAAVDLVTLSPLAEGLIQKAILQSGNALAPWAVSRDNLESALQIAKSLGHDNITNIEELSEVFTRISAPALMAVINEFDFTDNSLAFAPCVEREDLVDVEPFLLETPFQIISEGKFLQIPFMVGFVDNEGTIRSEEVIESDWLEQMEEHFTQFLQADLAFDNDEERTEVAESIRNFYFKENSIPQSLQRFITYQGDTMISVSAMREAQLRSTSSTVPLYLYQFSYKGTLGKPFVGPVEVDSAAHSEELAYMFYEIPLILETNAIPQRDLDVANILIERWTNFAKNGIPTSETSQITWRPYTVESPHSLRILNDYEEAVAAPIVTGSPLESKGFARNDEVPEYSALESEVDDPHSELLEFWNEIYADHFLDAQSNWEINVKNDDAETPDENVEGSGEEGGDEGEGSGEEESSDEEEGSGDEDSDDGSGDDGLPDSASTAVGYTFFIISAFVLLDQFHSTQILS